MSLKTVTSIDDLRVLHKRRVPRAFFDYCDRGSYAEETLDANRADLKALKLRQRVMVDVSNRSTETTILGEKVAYPFALAPTGLTGMQHADGEILAARAAEKAGIPFCLSTMSICSIEDVAAHTSKPFWFQLYVMKDWEFVENIINRAKAAKCSAMVLTLDLQILGQRHKDLKNGLSAPPKLTLPTMLNLATKWGWGIEMLQTRRRFFGNIVGHAKGVGDASSLTSWTNEQFDPQLDWGKIQRIREMWGGKIILKGILDVEDAQRAADFGADAIIVSNHGGRQLDGALSSIRMLPSIARAVGDRVEVLMDSGIRSGQDVLKALALGAHGTFIGRSYIYGLGAMGEAGVTKSLEVIRKELDISMALCGERNVHDLRRENLLVPADFEGNWA